MDRFVAGRYDLLVTDLRLPGHDGDVMARALRSVDPSMPTLLITGEDLSEGAVIFVFSVTHGRGFNKNYVREELAGDLKLRVRPVETYRERLMRKLDLHSVAELTRYAIA